MPGLASGGCLPLIGDWARALSVFVTDNDQSRCAVTGVKALPA